MQESMIKAFAHEAHDSIKQVRKYSGLPYWTHTDEVAGIVASVTDEEEDLAAAHLHDLLEDVFPKNAFYSLDRIRGLFGDRVASMVFDLTDQYTPENYPEWNRAIRKSKEADRLGATPARTQTIKLADIIVNTRDIAQSDPSFAKTYLKEKAYLLSKLTLGNEFLRGVAAQSIK